MKGKFIKILKNTINLDCEQRYIIAIHRIPWKVKGKPRSIIVKLSSSELKTSILRKKSEIFQKDMKIFDDITARNGGLINRLRSNPKVESVCFFNCSFYAKVHGKQKVKMDLFENVAKVNYSPVERVR